MSPARKTAVLALSLFYKEYPGQTPSFRELARDNCEESGVPLETLRKELAKVHRVGLANIKPMDNCLLTLANEAALVGMILCRDNSNDAMKRQEVLQLVREAWLEGDAKDSWDGGGWYENFLARWNTVLGERKGTSLEATRLDCGINAHIKRALARLARQIDRQLRTNGLLADAVQLAIRQALTEAITTNVVRAAFKTTGLVPFDENVIRTRARPFVRDPEVQPPSSLNSSLSESALHLVQAQTVLDTPPVFTQVSDPDEDLLLFISPDILAQKQTKAADQAERQQAAVDKAIQRDLGQMGRFFAAEARENAKREREWEKFVQAQARLCRLCETEAPRAGLVRTCSSCGQFSYCLKCCKREQETLFTVECDICGAANPFSATAPPARVQTPPPAPVATTAARQPSFWKRPANKRHKIADYTVYN